MTGKPASTLRDAFAKLGVQIFPEDGEEKLKKLKDLGSLASSTPKVTLVFASSVSTLLKKYDASMDTISDLKLARKSEPPCIRHRPGGMAPDHTAR